MSVETLPLLIMTGVSEGSAPEQMVDGARQAATVDLVEQALTIASLGPIVVATNSASLARRLAGGAFGSDQWVRSDRRGPRRRALRHLPHHV